MAEVTGTITVDHDRGVTVAELRGPLTLATVPGIRAILLKCLADCPTALIIDLAGLTADSDLPLAVFRAVQRQATRWPGVPMLLCQPSPALSARLDVLALGRDLPVLGTVADALAAVERPVLARPTVRLDLPTTGGAGQRARAAVARSCRDWSLESHREHAELIVSELVSNAVRHAAAPFQLLLAVRGDYLHLAVHDASPRLPVPPATTPGQPSTADHGWGLRLISAFASSWGSLPTANGKVVWATLRRGPT
jgi:anti-anti-sigma regulatory factor/anti-sigma regulatory factor (Ser/Thr protein kinase)